MPNRENQFHTYHNRLEMHLHLRVNLRVEEKHWKAGQLSQLENPSDLCFLSLDVEKFEFSSVLMGKIETTKL